MHGRQDGRTDGRIDGRKMTDGVAAKSHCFSGEPKQLVERSRVKFYTAYRWTYLYFNYIQTLAIDTLNYL